MKRALIQLHVAVFLWGFTGVLGKTISLNEGWLVWWRLLITVISLWLLFLVNDQITNISFKDFIKIGFIGIILSFHWLFFYGSIKYSNVSIALTCLSTTGLLAAVIEPLFFKRKINTAEIFLGLFALAGIAIIYFTNLKFSIGIIIGLLAALFTVLVSVMNKKMVTNYQPQTITLYQLTGGFIGLTLLMPFYNFLFPSITVFPKGYDWLWLIILSWCCTIFTFTLYINALKKLSAFTINLTLTLEPVYGIILAFAIYHENKSFNYTFYIGFFLILIAVTLQMFRVIKNQRKPLVVFE